MFVPLSDGNKLQTISFQYVNVSIIVVTVLVFAIFQSGGNPVPGVDGLYGATPAAFFGTAIYNPAIGDVSREITLVTYIFLHGGWMHLLGNMLFLWVFGDNVEDALGHFRYLIFYLACGIFAGLAHALYVPSSQIPLIGASGAVAGVVAAYLILYPRVKVWVLVLMRIPLRLPAVYLLSAWIILQVFNALLADESDQIAWWAHVGGLAAGAVLVLVLKRDDVPVFGR
ncbi:MAG: rhomboid family intramembrane serine protease [Alphaproteobacteria bacterium]